MAKTKLERETLEEIITWENNLMVDEKDWHQTFDEWVMFALSKMDEETKENVAKKVEEWLFYIQAAILQSRDFENRIEKLLEEARVYHEDIRTVKDLKNLPFAQLNFFADRHIGAHKIVSIVQGGITGTRNLLLRSMDLPVSIVLNIRLVQFIAASYGYDTKHPFEMMLALKVFYCSTLPKRFRREEWKKLIEETRTKKEKYFYDGNEQFVDSRWLSSLLLAIVKGSVVKAFSKREEKKRSFVAMAISAGYNYVVTKNVAKFAKRFYQYRYIMEKTEGEFDDLDLIENSTQFPG